MGNGGAHRTFYCPETPEQVDQVTFNLANYQTGIVNAAKASRDLTRLSQEFEAIGNGLIWNRDHFEIIPNRGVAQCNNLNVACMYTIYFCIFFHLTTQIHFNLH